MRVRVGDNLEEGDWAVRLLPVRGHRYGAGGEWTLLGSALRNLGQEGRAVMKNRSTRA